MCNRENHASRHTHYAWDMMWRDFEGKDRIDPAIWKLNVAIRVLYMNPEING
jgi:hypothetical protein